MMEHGGSNVYYISIAMDFTLFNSCRLECW